MSLEFEIRDERIPGIIKVQNGEHCIEIYSGNQEVIYNKCKEQLNVKLYSEFKEEILAETKNIRGEKVLKKSYEQVKPSLVRSKTGEDLTIIMENNVIVSPAYYTGIHNNENYIFYEKKPVMPLNVFEKMAKIGREMWSTKYEEVANARLGVHKLGIKENGEFIFYSTKNHILPLIGDEIPETITEEFIDGEIFDTLSKPLIDYINKMKSNNVEKIFNRHKEIEKKFKKK